VLALVTGLRGGGGPPQPSAVPPSRSAPVTDTTAPTQAGTIAASPSPTTTAAPSRRIGQFVGASAPVTIEVPSIGVRSSHVVDLGIAADGTITVPGTADEVGFYTGGPSPGQLGPAVLAAHVDSTTGPGVFYRLGAVQVGDPVTVTRADGSTTTFVVDKVASYPKDQFPTEEVYRGAFDQSEIRLVTCGGTFDRVKHYLDNVVVFGHLTDVA
jgi:hypothetical protein